MRLNIRSMITTLVGAVCLSTSVASAAAQLETPQALVQKASESRAAFFEVLRDLERNRPELRTRAEAEPYLFILKDLSDVAKKLDLDEMAGSVFKETAQRLTLHSMRWLKPEKDSLETVLRYHLFADEATAYDVVDRLQSNLSTIAVTDHMNLAKNLTALEARAIEKDSANFLIEGYRDIRASIATIQLKNVLNMTAEDRKFWLSQISSNTGWSAFLADQQNTVLSLDASNRSSFHTVGALFIESKELMNLQPGLQTYLHSQIGESTRELISRFVRFEEPFAPGEFQKLVSILQPAQLQGLTYIFTDVNRIPSKAYQAQYVEASKILVMLLEGKGLINEAAALKTYAEGIAAELMAATNSFEGAYRIRTTDGRTWIFNLIFARQDMLVAGLGEEKNGFVHFAYYNVSFNFAAQAYVASEQYPNDDVDHNAVIRFKFDGNGKILGTLEKIPGHGRLDFSGAKIETYMDLINDPSVPNTPELVDGVYSGKLNCNGFAKNVTLYVNTVSNYQIGSMSFDNETFYIEFPHGMRHNTKGLVYLTSAKLGSRSFTHFRGRLNKGVLSGDYIIGGQGQACTGIKLKKVK